jgi:hypothetical protein
MGYTSTAEGVIKISPPLSHQDLKGVPDFIGDDEAEVELVITEAEVETDQGTLINRQASVVRPKDEGEDWKRYYTDNQLQTLVAAFPGHEFHGYFEFLGEDGERWRTVLKGREVHEYVRPELRWPEL